MQWVPIDSRPLKTGKYLVGHRGWCEIMWFTGPEKEWVSGTQLGWHRADQRWNLPADDPKGRFNASHCLLIEGPE